MNIRKKTSMAFSGKSLLIIGLALLSLSSCNSQKKTPMEAPVAIKKPHELTKHEDTRIDNYYWLNERENPEVIAYLEAENAFTDKVLAHTEQLQQELYDEMLGRIKQTDISVPYKLNGYYYYTRYEEGKEYPLICRKKGSQEAAEEIMLDGNEMAEGHAYFQIGSWEINSDNNLLAYSVDTVSRRQYTIYVKSLSTGEIYTQTVPNASGNMAWGNDNKTLFYSVKDETLRPYRVMRHQVDKDFEQDVVVFTEDDPTFYAFVFKTKSKAYVMIGTVSTMSAEYSFVDANKPLNDFKMVQARQPDMLYGVDHYKNDFYIRTNLDAQNFRLMKTSVKMPGMENWKEVIPHRTDVLLEDFEIFSNYLAVSERQKGLVNIRVMSWDKKQDYYLDFGEPVYMAYMSTNVDFDTKVLRYGFTSLTTPNSVYDYDMAAKTRTLMKQQEVLGGYNPDDYASERLYVPSSDGVMVPVSLVYKKGLQKNGKNPLVLYGYGSYGASMDVYFSSTRLSLLDRGFVWAIAHIRGGEELGRQWYEDGKLLNKKNTFHDFIACGDYLVKEHYTDS